MKGKRGGSRNGQGEPQLEMQIQTPGKLQSKEVSGEEFLLGRNIQAP